MATSLLDLLESFSRNIVDKVKNHSNDIKDDIKNSLYIYEIDEFLKIIEDFFLSIGGDKDKIKVMNLNLCKYISYNFSPSHMISIILERDKKEYEDGAFCAYYSPGVSRASNVYTVLPSRRFEDLNLKYKESTYDSKTHWYPRNIAALMSLKKWISRVVARCSANAALTASVN